MDTVKLIQVIEATLTRRGSGKSGIDPVRIITQYWSTEGVLLAEKDHWKEKEEITQPE